MTGASTKPKGAFRLALSLGWLAGVNVCVSLIIQWYVLTYLGIGVESDAFFAAMIVPQIVGVFFTSALLHVLVPVLAASEVESGFDLRQELWGIILQVGAVATLAAATLYFTSAYWMRWLAPGFSPVAYSLAVVLTGIQLFSLPFAAADCVLRAACRARRSFLRAEAATPVANIVGLLLLAWALPRYGVHAAAWITVLRIALPVVFMWPVLGGWRRPHLWSPSREKALRRIKPLLLGGLYNHIPPLVTRQLASLAPAGGLSLLTASQQLYRTANMVLDTAIVIPASPALAVYAQGGQWGNFRKLYRGRLRLLALLAVAGYALLLACGRPLLALTIGHGGVTNDNINSLWWMLAVLGLGFVANTSGQPVFAAFCAKGDTRTPVRLALIINTVSLPARALAFWAYGLGGMALAISASAALSLLVNIIFLERSIPAHDGSPTSSAQRTRPGEDAELPLGASPVVDAT
jgi:peptidoglycan biosynthesis protein MviN/MurJ (putative lipid II flippase)